MSVRFLLFFSLVNFPHLSQNIRTLYFTLEQSALEHAHEYYPRVYELKKCVVYLLVATTSVHFFKRNIFLSVSFVVFFNFLKKQLHIYHCKPGTPVYIGWRRSVPENVVGGPVVELSV